MEQGKDLVNALLEKGLTFVLFSSPRNKDFRLFVNNENSGHVDEVFVFHPFDTGMHSPIEIANAFGTDSEEIKKFIQAAEPVQAEYITPICSTKDEHLNLVQEVVETIQVGTLDKVVLSRVKAVPNDGGADLVELIEKLNNQLPENFTYMLHHPKTGTWIGSTPEILLQNEQNRWKTMSLAGTMLIDENRDWTAKEYDEQAWVTKYIIDQLDDRAKQSLVVSDLSDHAAGPVKHLKNTIQFRSDKSAEEWLSKLHPTPAVCGIPLAESKRFILEKEKHDRSYYAGYLGLINKQSSSYYVNIRCMQCIDGDFYLYLGGGITAESDPELEYQETENKAKTLLSVINNL